MNALLSLESLCPTQSSSHPRIFRSKSPIPILEVKALRARIRRSFRVAGRPREIATQRALLPVTDDLPDLGLLPGLDVAAMHADVAIPSELWDEAAAARFLGEFEDQYMGVGSLRLRVIAGPRHAPNYFDLGFDGSRYLSFLPTGDGHHESRESFLQGIESVLAGAGHSGLRHHGVDSLASPTRYQTTAAGVPWSPLTSLLTSCCALATTADDVMSGWEVYCEPEDEAPDLGWHLYELLRELAPPMAKGFVSFDFRIRELRGLETLRRLEGFEVEASQPICQFRMKTGSRGELIARTHPGCRGHSVELSLEDETALPQVEAALGMDLASKR